MLQELEKQQEATEEQEKIIVVHFEPWNFTDSNQLLNQFFARLANEFRSKSDKGLKAICTSFPLKFSMPVLLFTCIPRIIN